jgi:hypothetical protein
MVLVKLFNTGMILLSKVSIGGGMFIFSLLAYRSFFGAVFILPFALVYERYSRLPFMHHWIKKRRWVYSISLQGKVEGHELESVRIYILQRVYRVYVHASVII